MAVLIGSARIDENGRTHGGRSGDQTGKEVSTQTWYLHPKGWVTIRPKSEKVAEKIAETMEKACASEHVGYDQYQNQTLWNAMEKIDFNIDDLVFDVETDCARLVRVCVRSAGVKVEDFYTGTAVKVLKETGQFDILTSSKYTTQSAYLKRGDILCTKTKGHIVIVLTDGSKVARPKVYQGALSLPPKGYIERGDEGTYVKNLQKFLNWYGGYGLAVDGIFGVKTQTAVKRFQKAMGIDVDGVFGKQSLKKAKAVKK